MGQEQIYISNLKSVHTEKRKEKHALVRDFFICHMALSIEKAICLQRQNSNVMMLLCELLKRLTQNHQKDAATQQ